MGRDRDIYMVSIPMVCGAVAAAFASQSASAIPYLMAAISFPCLALATLPSVSTAGEFHWRISYNPVFWIAVFFIAGAVSYTTAHIVSSGHTIWNPFAGMAERASSGITSLPFKDEENKALLKALILGDRTYLSKATTSHFRDAGAAHLLALSGMHLGIIYLIINKMLSIFGNRPPARKARSFSVIMITGIYTAMCGAGPSLVRAWLFILLNEGAKILERPQPPQQIFCAALTLHIITKPEGITGIGFQLSYLAMVGIVFVWPHIRAWMDSRIWQALSLSISCQLFTAPLTLIYFHTFPKYFMITNLIAAPLMPIVIVTGMIAIAANAAGLDWNWLYMASEMPASALRYLLELISGL